jgi:outer membrane beta-barrel protein
VIKMMTTTTTRRTLMLALAVSFAGAATAHADRRNPLENQPSIRHKFEMRRLRFEITPQLVTSINQDFRHFIGGGLVLQFHITDWLGIGVSGAFGGGIDTGTTSKVVGVLQPQANLPDTTNIQPSNEQFRDHLATINLIASAYATLTPFSGKMMIFGALLLRYDFYAMAGIGIINLTNTWSRSNPGADQTACMNGNPNYCDPLNSGAKVGGMFGVGAHLFFNDFVGLNLELRDHLNSTNPGGLDVNGDRQVTSDDATISNNFFFLLGVTIMLPPKAKISD